MSTQYTCDVCFKQSARTEKIKFKFWLRGEVFSNREYFDICDECISVSRYEGMQVSVIQGGFFKKLWSLIYAK